MIGFLVFFASVLSSLSVMFAQQVLGTISGTVTDSSGAVIGGATVNVRNNGTGLTREQTTTSNGFYAFQNLPIGSYTATVTKEGFDAQVYPTIQIQANSTVTLNVQLRPGRTSTSVTVQGTPLLNAEIGRASCR